MCDHRSYVPDAAGGPNLTERDRCHQDQKRTWTALGDDHERIKEHVRLLEKAYPLLQRSGAGRLSLLAQTKRHHITSGATLFVDPLTGATYGIVIDTRGMQAETIAYRKGDHTVALEELACRTNKTEVED